MPPDLAPRDPDDEALFAALENEDDSSYRDQRIQQLNAEFAAQKTNRDPSSTTTILHKDIYPTLSSDQSVLDFTTSTARCLVHFAHPDFNRCKVMDSALEKLAGVHYEVRFARADVESTPFLVEKLKIKILPCVIGFKDGVGVDRVVGFEGLETGGRDGGEGFSVSVLEKRLLFKGVLIKAKLSSPENDDDSEGERSESEGFSNRINTRPAIRSGNAQRLRNRVDDDDDDDWD